MSNISNILKERNSITLTENGAKAYKSTNSRCLDLFFAIGSMKNNVYLNEEKYESDLINLIDSAYQENSDLTEKIIAWSRDIREGAGSRFPIITFMKVLVANDKFKLSDYTLNKIVDLGYYKDIFNIYNTKNITNGNKQKILEWCKNEINKNNPNKIGLFSKWFPRKDKLFYDLCKYMKWNYSKLRKFISSNTKVVESQMCRNEWDSINFETVPSIAMNRYSYSFSIKSKTYSEYLELVKSGKAKINTTALTPVDLTLKAIKSSMDSYNYTKDVKESLNVLWNNLSNDFMPNEDMLFLPVADVSGSMETPGCIPMSASVGLSYYLSQRNPGIWKNTIITFSSEPTIIDLPDNIEFTEAVYKIMKAEWGYSTDINKVFELLLNMTKSFSNTDIIMPTHIIVLSDMQFNENERDSGKTNFEYWKSEYSKLGFKLPKIIFWNLNPHTNFPAKNTDDVLMVSGYSTKILSDLFNNADIDSMQLMLDAVDKEKYVLFEK